MIKPTALWNFLHECDERDAELAGRICLALAGKISDDKFSRAELIQLNVIRKDSEDMDEFITARRHRDRARKAARQPSQHAPSGSADAGGSGGAAEAGEAANAGAPPCAASVAPCASVAANSANAATHPFSPAAEDAPQGERECHVRESDGRPDYLPTDSEAAMMARQINVPLDYVQTFMALMESKGWGYVNRGGSQVNLNRRNFKAVLSSFWGREKEKRREGRASETALHQAGYKLRLGKREAK